MSASRILEIAERLGAKLKRVTTSEWSGPCPVCGGTDRFTSNTTKQMFYCRQCKVGGDAIQLARHVTGMGYVEAYQFVHGEEPPDRRLPRIAPPPAPAPAPEPADESKVAQSLAKWWEPSGPARGTIAETGHLASRALTLDADIDGRVIVANRFPAHARG